MAALAAGALAVAGAAGATVASASTSHAGAAGSATAYRVVAGNTTTPIKHLVVIFQENVSFDHYFGTYPKAANNSGQPFHAAANTPSVNNLANTKGAGGKGNLLTNNPNQDASGNQVNPRRLNPANINDVLTCDQDHDYGPEQQAFDGGKMDKFVTSVGTGSGTSGTGQPCKASDVMNYYDGNTVTGLWN
jgi:phospholipase C